jgi:hypothetical protein
VKGGAAEDAVEHAVKRNILQVDGNEEHLGGKFRLKVFARGLQHVLREVHGHDASAGQAFQ